MSNGNNTQEQEVPQSDVELNKDEICQDAISELNEIRGGLQQ